MVVKNIKRRKTINYQFGEKHKEYIRKCAKNTINVAEGAVRAGKTVDNIYAFAHELKTTPDKIHLATGSTIANAKLNIGDANGFGLEYIFRNQCHWGKYKGNECLYIKGIDTKYKEKIVIFAGAAKADSYKKIRGNSYGMWIATEINLHHDNTIKEAFNRQLAAKRIKVFWDLNPDNPKAKIYTEYIDLYAKKQKKGTFVGGYNYEHFTIFDNITITEERKAEIISRYEKSSIWYLRDIEGKRCIAEGLIFEQIADNEQRFMTKQVQLNSFISIGIDWGGNKSKHSITATKIDRMYRKVQVLKSSTMKATGTNTKKVFRWIVNFIKEIQDRYGTVSFLFADSAEQVLNNSLEGVLKENEINLVVQDSVKTQIKNRIDMFNRLLNLDKLTFIEGQTQTIIEALQTALFDDKAKDDRWIDDGETSDIDSLDSFTYSFEYWFDEISYYLKEVA